MAAVRVEFGPVSYVFSSARGMLEVPGEQPRESEESLFQCILVHISTSETGQIFPYPPFRCTNFFSSTIFFIALIGTIKLQLLPGTHKRLLLRSALLRDCQRITIHAHG